MRSCVRALLKPAIDWGGLVLRGEAGELKSQVQVVMSVGTGEAS